MLDPLEAFGIAMLLGTAGFAQLLRAAAATRRRVQRTPNP
jgi:hypothetical protein